MNNSQQKVYALWLNEHLQNMNSAIESLRDIENDSSYQPVTLRIRAVVRALTLELMETEQLLEQMTIRNVL